MNQTMSYFDRIFSSNAIEYCTNECIKNNEQSNFILSTEFPLWILNRNFSFSSMKTHIDIYLYTKDLSTNYSDIYDQVHENYQKILVDDENSSIRLNHVNVLGNLQDPYFESVFVTNKDVILPSKFIFNNLYSHIVCCYQSLLWNSKYL